MLAAQALEACLCYRSPAGPAGLVWAPFKGRLCAVLELCSHAMGSGLSRRREPQRNFKHYKDLWRMDLEQHTWELLPAKGGPAGRSGHRMALHRNRLIVFGGFNDSGKVCRCEPPPIHARCVRSATLSACAARHCQRARCLAAGRRKAQGLLLSMYPGPGWAARRAVAGTWNGCC